MKWYSVKKYAPPMQVTCLILTENNYFYVARLIDGNDYSVWITDADCQACGSIEEHIYGVTHFCIPSPVKIEE